MAVFVCCFLSASDPRRVRKPPKNGQGHTVDAGSEGKIRVIGQRLGDVGVGAIRILVFLRGHQ